MFQAWPEPRASALWEHVQAIEVTSASACCRCTAAGPRHERRRRRGLCTSGVPPWSGGGPPSGGAQCRGQPLVAAAPRPPRPGAPRRPPHAAAAAGRLARAPPHHPAAQLQVGRRFRTALSCSDVISCNNVSCTGAAAAPWLAVALLCAPAALDLGSPFASTVWIIKRCACLRNAQASLR